MTSIDEVFQNAGVSSKRKLDPLRDPNEIYKSAKLAPNGRSNRHARVSDTDPNNDDSALEAGPAPPPGDDDSAYGPAAPPLDSDDEGAAEDDEGRFFGSGMTSAERAMLDFVNENETTDPSTAAAAAADDDTIDLPWLRKRALAFEKKITRNAEQRAKFATDPARFMDSEAELDADLRALSILGEHPALYHEAARLGTAASLAGLLAHENTDIALGAVEIIAELTGDDTGATEEQWGALVDALLEADLLGLLVSNFERLDEREEVDRDGVYHAMEILENLCSRTDTAETVGASDDLLRWLLARARRSETPVVGQNKQYAAELLAILVQTSAANRRRLAALDAVDTLLELVAPYRRRDPARDSDEEEYVANLFDALVCLVDEIEGKARFVEAEGTELCLILAREGKLARPAALRLLDHAVSSGPEVAANIVAAGGLKTLFTLFVSKKAALQSTTTEHLISIFGAMLRVLPSDTPERIRLLAKFVEKDFEKTKRLVQLRREYAARVAAADVHHDQQQASRGPAQDPAQADAQLSRRLDAGLFSLQTIDLILAFLVAEDAGARATIMDLLAERDETLGVVKSSLQEQIEGMEVEEAEGEEGRHNRDMLEMLLAFL